MMYPILTACVGGCIAILSLWSLVRAFGDGGIFVTQLRFLISGLLLAFHFPLVSLISSLLEPYLAGVAQSEGLEGVAFWSAILLLITAQLIVLPTGRELYGTYLADRLSRRSTA